MKPDGSLALNESFVVKEVEDPTRSRIEKRKVMVLEEFKKIRFPGSPDFIFQVVTDADRETEAYRAWREGRERGTPIERLLGKPLGEGEVNQELIDELKAAGVATVENLAHAPDSARGIPVLHQFRRLAQDTLAAAKVTDEAEAVAKRDGEVATLRAKTEALEAELARFRQLWSEGRDLAPGAKP